MSLKSLELARYQYGVSVHLIHLCLSEGRYSTDAAGWCRPNRLHRCNEQNHDLSVAAQHIYAFPNLSTVRNCARFYTGTCFEPQRKDRSLAHCSYVVGSVCSSPLCRQNTVPGKRRCVTCTDAPYQHAKSK